MTDHGFRVGDSVYVLDTHTMIEHPGTITKLDMGYNGHIQVELGEGPFKVIVHPSRISPVLTRLPRRHYFDYGICEHCGSEDVTSDCTPLKLQEPEGTSS